MHFMDLFYYHTGAVERPKFQPAHTRTDSHFTPVPNGNILPLAFN